MLKIRRILLPVRDLRLIPRAALRKAASLARTTGASIELFHAVDGSSGPPATAAGDGRRRPGGRAALPGTALQQAERRLERLERSPLLEGCRVRAVAAEDSPPHEAIVRRALAVRADLVVAATHSRSLAARLFLRNTDWELIRYCPCPLLLVKSPRLHRTPAILVAVDPYHAHAKPARLDEQLLAAGSSMARILHGSTHVFHAYMPLIANVQGPLGEPVVWESPEIENTHRDQVRRGFDALAEKAGIPRPRRHLVMGDVPSELDRAVRRLKAGLVVMGAVSRSGLERLFIGNTAERVLDQLACDVLIVKPRGFKTTVPGRLSPPR